MSACRRRQPPIANRTCRRKSVQAVRGHSRGAVNGRATGSQCASVQNVAAGNNRLPEGPEIRRAADEIAAALHNDSHSAWLYSASDIEVLTDAQLATHPFLKRLGPDVLDDSLTREVLATRLAERTFRGRSLAALYLDQGFLAGIGNYLRSEILFTAGLHGNDRPQDLTAAERRRLAAESLKLSRRSYRTGGITLPAQRVRSLKAAGQDYAGYRFWVFGRDGHSCYRCTTTIDRVDAGSRRWYYCRACQPRKR